MNQRNEHIGLFFGSFNPIHLGHLALANYFVDNHYVDKVWFVVSPQSPFKNSKDIAPFQHRLKMVDIAVADAENISSCDIESKMPLPSFTVDTLNELRNKYVDKKFSVILGSDQLEDFKNWKNWEDIVDNHKILFYPREGNFHSNIPNTQIVNAPLLNVSSTMVRNYIEAGKSVKNLIPDSVNEYIILNKLYKSKPLSEIMLKSLFLLFFFVLTLASNQTFAQFYNGLQMDFGKKKIQYKDFMWSYYQYDDYDIYFYQNGQNLAIEANNVIKANLELIENKFNIRVDNKLKVIVYNTLSDFSQTNLGTLSETNYNTGGITYIIDNKAFVYFNGDMNHFREQIKASLYKIIISESMKGSKLSNYISDKEDATDWFVDGLAAYYAIEWTSAMENKFRNLIEGGKVKKLRGIAEENAAVVGQSVWKYIAERYGKDVPMELFRSAIRQKNHYDCFDRILNISFKNLEEDWLEYYEELYSTYKFTEEDNFTKSILKTKKRNKSLTISNIELDPTGRKLAYVANESGLKKLFIVDIETGKKTRVYKTGYRSYNKADDTFPVMAWHPNGQILAVATEEEGGSKIFFFDVGSGNIFFPNNLSLSSLSFQKILDMSYSSDARNIVLSAVKDGQTDIFLWNITSGVAKQLTDDIYNDFNPSFTDNNTEIIFSSNRNIKDEKLGYYNNIFKINLDNLTEITQYSNTPYADEIKIKSAKDGTIYYISDENGIYNLYTAQFDSTISFVDTITHYNYFMKTRNVTNSNYNIIDYDIVGNTIVTLSEANGKQVVVKENIKSFDAATLSQTINKRNTIIQDSLSRIQKKENKRTLNFYDVTEFDLREEIPTVYTLLDVEVDTNRISKMKLEAQLADEDETDKWRFYKPEFFINSLITQIDFTSMSNSYQQFSGGTSPVYLYKGFNLLTGVGITDLMEDYKLTGAFSLSTDLINNEYAVSFSNLKKRLDKEIIFHRFTNLNYPDGWGYVTEKQRTHEFIYKLTWPFTEFMHVSGFGIVKNNQTYTTNILDISSVGDKIKKSNWVGVRGEFVFDNTIGLAQNILIGTRFKLFGEYSQVITKENRNLIVLGFDFRNYQRIYRELIFAWRVAGSSSLGSDRLVYYMGGVDNWILPHFNSDNQVSPDINYAYQTLATNMRGFAQNTRNGPNFAVVNAELRFPFVRVFANRPIGSKFLNSLQMVGFCDFGTAWNGLTPYSEENSLFIKKYDEPPMHIEVSEHRDPFLLGFGLGVRASILGYFVRVDYGWGLEDGFVNDGYWNISFSLDF